MFPVSVSMAQKDQRNAHKKLVPETYWGTTAFLVTKDENKLRQRPNLVTQNIQHNVDTLGGVLTRESIACEIECKRRAKAVNQRGRLDASGQRPPSRHVWNNECFKLTLVFPEMVTTEYIQVAICTISCPHSQGLPIWRNNSI